MKNPGFDPLLAMLSAMCACASQSQVPALTLRPRPGASTSERHRHYQEFGREPVERKTKAQLEAEKAAASIGHGPGGKAGR